MIKIKQRIISQNEKKVVIIDAGEIVRTNNEQVWINDVVIEYEYDRQSGHMYFTSTPTEKGDAW